MRALEAEGHVEGMLRQFGCHGVGEVRGAQRAIAAGRDGVEVAAVELAVP